MPLFHDFFIAPKYLKSDPSEPAKAKLNGPETRPIQMSLEERMTYRRDMLFSIVRASLTQFQVDPHDYHFKIVRIDRSGHCFVVMMDMLPAFMQSQQGEHSHLSRIANFLTRSAMDRCGLVVSGVYWRIDERMHSGDFDGQADSAPSDAGLLESANTDAVDK
jgi:hypothetical protein